MAYAGLSTLVATEGTARLELAGNLRRDPVRFEATIKEPLRFREAMAALYAVVASDFRYVPKDRTAYLAYSRMRRESSSLNAWQAQRAYFSWLLQQRPAGLRDPRPGDHGPPGPGPLRGLQQGRGGVRQARRGSRRLRARRGRPACGTTNIDFSQSLYAGIQQMRSYRETRLSIGQEGVKFATATAGEVLEKQIRVPDSWLRGFLQVQSSAALPRDRFDLAPVDLYNALRHLRLHADRKGQRRGPADRAGARRAAAAGAGAVERGDPVHGRTVQGEGRAGRPRLGPAPALLIHRFLPFVEEVEVHVLGSGLPSFWVLRAAGHDADPRPDRLHRRQLVAGDQLRPAAAAQDRDDQQAARRRARSPAQHWSAGAGELAQATGLAWPALTEALQLGCQQARSCTTWRATSTASAR